MKMFLRLSEVATMTGVTTQTLRNWTNSGKVKCVRTVGNHRRIPSSEVEKLIRLVRTDNKK